MVLKEYSYTMSAIPQVAKASGHQVLCGPAVVPDGCAHVLVQAVLDGVDVDSLLHIVRKSIVVPDNPVAEEKFTKGYFLICYILE